MIKVFIIFLCGCGVVDAENDEANRNLNFGTIRLGVSDLMNPTNAELPVFQNSSDSNNILAVTNRITENGIDKLKRFIHVRFALTLSIGVNIDKKSTSKLLAAPAQVFLVLAHSHTTCQANFSRECDFAEDFVTTVKEERVFGTTDVTYKFTVDLLNL